MLMELPRYCSVSGCSQKRTDHIPAIMQKKAAFLLDRVRGISTCILIGLSRFDGPLLRM